MTSQRQPNDPFVAGTRTFMIPISDLTLDDRGDIRYNVDTWLYDAAKRLAIKDQQMDLLERDISPNVDLNLAAQDDWLIVGPGVLATDLQYIGFALPLDKCIAFYGIAVETAPNTLSRVRFTLGAASSEVRGYFQLEQLYSRLEPVGYFSEPIGYVRQDFIRIMVMPRIAFGANTQRVQLLGRTIEPVGVTVSRPSS